MVSLLRQRGWLGAIALVVVVALVIALKRPAHAPAATAERDVPHLEGDAIVFSQTFLQRAELRYENVQTAPFQRTVEVVGTVTYNPSYVAAVGTRLRGFVRRTLKFEGDAVKAGDALAEVESAELGEAQSSVQQARARLAAAELNVTRERDLMQKQLTTAREAEVAEAELASMRASLQAAEQRTRAFGGAHQGAHGLFIMKAPLDGQVVECHVVPGQSVDGDFIGYKIADLNHLWVELAVFERDITAVNSGDAVDVVPVASNAHIPAKVAHVGEVIDPSTRSTQVRVAIDNPSVHLRPGQSVHATITSGTRTDDALLIPRDAVVYVDGQATVFVAETDTKVRPITVQLGGENQTVYEVVKGLQAGQRVAVAGVFALKSELYR